MIGLIIQYIEQPSIKQSYRQGRPISTGIIQTPLFEFNILIINKIFRFLIESELSLKKNFDANISVLPGTVHGDDVAHSFV